MNFIRRFVSAIILIASVVVLVGICMEYDWGIFADVFKGFTFNKLVVALNDFFALAGNAIVLVMLGFIGLTMPNPAK